MGYVSCRKCNGTGKFLVENKKSSGWFPDYKSYPCKACDGTGINKNLYEKSCEYGYCGETIVYPKEAQYPPKYCKYHKQVIQSEKEEQRKQKERERAEKAAKWKEKNCVGVGLFGCNNKIKYNIEWDKIPELCPNCIRKKKEEAQAKWKIKSCSICGSDIKYHADWANIPDSCNSCKNKQKSSQVTRNAPLEKKRWIIQDDNEHYTVKVSGEYGHTKWGEVRTDFLIFDKKTGKHKHFSTVGDGKEALEKALNDWHGWKY